MCMEPKVALRCVQVNNVEVNWSDQQNINTFGKLNSRRIEVTATIKAKKVGGVCKETSCSVAMICIFCTNLLVQQYRTADDCVQLPVEMCPVMAASGVLAPHELPLEFKHALA